MLSCVVYQWSREASQPSVYYSQPPVHCTPCTVHRAPHTVHDRGLWGPHTKDIRFLCSGHSWEDHRDGEVSQQKQFLVSNGWWCTIYWLIKPCWRRQRYSVLQLYLFNCYCRRGWRWCLQLLCKCIQTHSVLYTCPSTLLRSPPSWGFSGSPPSSPRMQLCFKDNCRQNTQPIPNS